MESFSTSRYEAHKGNCTSCAAYPCCDYSMPVWKHNHCREVFDSYAIFFISRLLLLDKVMLRYCRRVFDVKAPGFESHKAATNLYVLICQWDWSVYWSSTNSVLTNAVWFDKSDLIGWTDGCGCRCRLRKTSSIVPHIAGGYQLECMNTLPKSIFQHGILHRNLLATFNW